jgi:2-oxoisovalerate dehydrogenase E1 component
MASEIAALTMENCFEFLDAPVMRVGSLDTPVPFAAALEQNYLPKTRFAQTLTELLAY